MSLDPVRFFECLGDETRLMLVVLREQELCVCEMTHALQVSQPKVSRHVAQLRRCGLLMDRREGQWVYYDLAPDLPEWGTTALDAAAEGRSARLGSLRARLSVMGNRPSVAPRFVEPGAPRG